jgi:hypothetical protein
MDFISILLTGIRSFSCKEVTNIANGHSEQKKSRSLFCEINYKIGQNMIIYSYNCTFRSSKLKGLPIVTKSICDNAT